MRKLNGFNNGRDTTEGIGGQPGLTNMPRPIKRDETQPEKLYTQAEMEEENKKLIAWMNENINTTMLYGSETDVNMVYEQYKQQNP